MNAISTLSGSILVYNGSFIDYLGDPNPLKLPPFTLRVKIEGNVMPSNFPGSATRISSTIYPSTSIWDLTYNNSDWSNSLSGCSIIEVIGANLTGVESMEGLFRGHGHLESVCFFDTSTVINVAGMFSNCTRLTSVPRFNTRHATDMSNMFNGCSRLTSIPTLDTSSARFMSATFSGCKSISTIPPLNTSKVYRMDFMFYGSTIREIPLIDTSNVYNMESMFENSSLEKVPLLDTRSVTRMNRAFYDCKNVREGSLKLYQQTSTQTNPPSIYAACFTNCGINTQTGLAELQQIPTSWGGLAT